MSHATELPRICLEATVACRFKDRTTPCLLFLETNYWWTGGNGSPLVCERLRGVFVSEKVEVGLPAASVDAQLDLMDLSEGRKVASFTLTLRHENGVHSHFLPARSIDSKCMNFDPMALTAAMFLLERLFRPRQSLPGCAL